MNWRGSRRKCMRRNLRYCPAFSWNDWSKSQKSVMISQSLDEVLYPGPLKYEPGVQTTQPRWSNQCRMSDHESHLLGSYCGFIALVCYYACQVGSWQEKTAMAVLLRNLVAVVIRLMVRLVYQNSKLELAIQCWLKWRHDKKGGHHLHDRYMYTQPDICIQAHDIWGVAIK